MKARDETRAKSPAKTDLPDSGRELEESNRNLERALEELKKTQKNVIHTERMRALGQMASGIAHDFNNALTQILGFTELLLIKPEEIGHQQKTTQYLELIRTAAKDAAEIVRRMGEFYRPRGKGERFGPVIVEQLVTEVIALTRPKWKDQAEAGGITITIEADLRGRATITGNEAELREMLINLILNSVDAMPGGGKITLRTDSGDGRNLLKVSDTGIGMTEEVRQNCLEPFFTTKGKQGSGLGLGLGLGLAAVHGILTRHGGTMTVSSRPAEGTTFAISLPADEINETDGIRIKRPPPTEKKRILVVEDNAMVLRVIREFLTRDNHRVVTATDGREGKRAFRKGDFDLVITDRAMPVMSGDQLAALIRRISPNMPIILLTGFGDMMATTGESPSGINLILSKPITLRKLRRAIAKVLPPDQAQRTFVERSLLTES